MKAVVVLEVMWDWRNVTGRAGYKDRAPRFFDINPGNHSGKRLHKWLAAFPGFLVTNACPQLVARATDRGTPDPLWLSENLSTLAPDLLLICGDVAQKTFRRISGYRGNPRIIEIPHPAARFWNKAGIALVADLIGSGAESVSVTYDRHTKTFTASPMAVAP